MCLYGSTSDVPRRTPAQLSSSKGALRPVPLAVNVCASPAAMFSLVTERTHRFFWRLSVAIMFVITTVDALLGPRIILIGLLMVGPCCALFSARRVSTAQAGAVAVGLALVLALPDGIWGTVAQFAFTGAVLIVAIACTWAAGIIESASRP